MIVVVVNVRGRLFEVKDQKQDGKVRPEVGPIMCRFSFDIAIDKSTIDALLCGDDAYLKVAQMLRET